MQCGRGKFAKVIERLGKIRSTGVLGEALEKREGVEKQDGGRGGGRVRSNI